eukprot:1157221-Pelagomonas_calceolata.AAC.3
MGAAWVGSSAAWVCCVIALHGCCLGGQQRCTNTPHQCCLGKWEHCMSTCMYSLFQRKRLVSWANSQACFNENTCKGDRVLIPKLFWLSMDMVGSAQLVMIRDCVHCKPSH